ncbi:Protein DETOXIFICATION 34 [Linum grandiflorum]
MLFSSNPKAMKEAADLAYLCAGAMLLEIMMPVLHGVAVGAGWQVQVAIVNVVCYYVVGLPVAAVLGYKFKLGVEGIWAGLVSGYVLQFGYLMASKSEQRMKYWGVKFLRPSHLLRKKGVLSLKKAIPVDAEGFFG